MRRMLCTLLCFVVVVPMLVVPEQVQAKTLAQLREELRTAEANYAQKEQEERLTQEQIDQTNQSVEDIKNDMIQIDKDIETLGNEIIKLNQEITAKEKEIKNIVNFVQVSNGESAYLEYAFGAQDFTDFIYRMSIAEQLADYNEKLIADFTTTIENSKKKQVELKEKTKELEQKQKQLENELSGLKDKMASLSDIKISVKDEIRMLRESVEGYEKSGCGENEDLDACMTRIQNSGGGSLPPINGFYRPIVKGHATSEYGWRCLDITGCELHSGLDMSVAGGGVPVYAAAPGVVAGLIHRSNCGGNQVIIIHTINGQKYTTLYAHLRSMNVSVGQVVTASTQIGIMGGNPQTEWWDKCSTGNHVHFTVATGHYLKDYYSWNTFMNHTINPRTVTNVPARGVEFTNRTTRY